MEFASNAKGNLGVTLGAIGTGLGLVNGGAGLLGMGGAMPMNNGMNNCWHFATKEDLALSSQIAAKDSEIALLKAEQASENKMVEVYRQSRSELVDLRDRIDSELKDLRKEVQQNRRDQDAWNASQSVANAQMSSAIACNNKSIAAINDILGKITMVRVPNSAICPGWGEVTVAPVTP